MNLLEKLMSIINKQKQAILFSQKDKEIIREISQCNNSYYKTKVLDIDTFVTTKDEKTCSRPLLSRSGCISKEVGNGVEVLNFVLVPFYRGAVVFA